MLGEWSPVTRLSLGNTSSAVNSYLGMRVHYTNILRRYPISHRDIPQFRTSGAYLGKAFEYIKLSKSYEKDQFID